VRLAEEPLGYVARATQRIKVLLVGDVIDPPNAFRGEDHDAVPELIENEWISIQLDVSGRIDTIYQQGNNLSVLTPIADRSPLRDTSERFLCAE
jgi:hypothetical protein